MRIAWLSPAAGNSGIVEFTRQVLPALARHAEPELWSHGPPERPPCGIPCVDYAGDPQALVRLAGYDAVVYNLGNHLRFHRAEYEVSARVPGIVVLHDRTLHHFFAGYYITYLRRPELYLERMAALYGERGREVGAAVLAQHGEGAWSRPEEVVEHAFIEDSLANAIGAVTHSAGHAAAVRRRWGGPVCDLPMPAYESQLRHRLAPSPPAAGDAITLMSVGHVDRNKHILTVVEALASAPELAARIRYLIIGQYDARSAYIRDLNRTIADASLARTVTLLGYTPDATLERYAANADVFVNLRSPNLESGSASLMEQLARGRPVVVYDSGAYGELPDETVVKVAVDDRAGLVSSLHELVGDAELRRRLGLAARRHAEAHRVDAYARSLAWFAAAATAGRARLRLADSVGTQLRTLGVAPDAAAVLAIADELSALLAPPGS
jgi:glycosyltransferase involved in cell wall biosynthesis